MKEQSQELNNLSHSLPSYNSGSSCSQLNSILSKYTSILDYFNSYNEYYRRATTLFYTDISTIRDNIQQSLYATSLFEKNKAFEKARNILKRDIDALASLIKPQENVVEMTTSS